MNKKIKEENLLFNYNSMFKKIGIMNWILNQIREAKSDNYGMKPSSFEFDLNSNQIQRCATMKYSYNFVGRKAGLKFESRVMKDCSRFLNL